MASVLHLVRSGPALARDVGLAAFMLGGCVASAATAAGEDLAPGDRHLPLSHVASLWPEPPLSFGAIAAASPLLTTLNAPRAAADDAVVLAPFADRAIHLFGAGVDGPVAASPSHAAVQEPPTINAPSPLPALPNGGGLENTLPTAPATGVRQEPRSAPFTLRANSRPSGSTRTV